MKTLITGGSGFLGAHLRALLPDADAPGRADLDVTSHHLDLGAYDRVFHLAAQTRPGLAEEDPSGTLTTNVFGTQHVAQAMRDDAVLVFVSTCHVYGRPVRLPIDEDHPRAPRGVYASSKLAAERLVEERAIIARPFNLTGPGQSTDFALADWAAQGRAGQRRIRCGNVDLARDYLDVRDCAAGLVLLSERGEAGRAYNLCSETPYRLEDLLRRVSGGEPDPDPERFRPNDVPVLYGSAARAKKLGWAPSFTIEETLRDL